MWQCMDDRDSLCPHPPPSTTSLSQHAWQVQSVWGKVLPQVTVCKCQSMSSRCWWGWHASPLHHHHHHTSHPTTALGQANANAHLSVTVTLILSLFHHCRPGRSGGGIEDEGKGRRKRSGVSRRQAGRRRCHVEPGEIIGGSQGSSVTVGGDSARKSYTGNFQ